MKWALKSCTSAGALALAGLVGAGASAQAPVAAAGGESVSTGAAGDVQTSPQPAPAVTPTAAATPDQQDIVVTGSRIARRDFVAQSPIVTTTQAAVENAGTATVDQYLRQLPQFQPGTGNFTNPTSGGNVGQATLNLRGLGAQRNLVLLDGRRLTPSNSQATVDINTIPSAAIGSLEVISGGASATYGSDAVAGVVNFKLRRGFTGIEVNGQAGLATGPADAGNQQISAIVGTKFADGRGAVFVAGEYVHRDGVLTNDRAFFRTGTPSSFLPQGVYVANGSNLPSAAAVNAVFARYGVAAGGVTRTNNLGFNNDGTLFRSTFPALNYRGPTDSSFIVSNTQFGFNGSYNAYIQIPLSRENGFARADYELSDAVKLYAQGLYSRSVASSIGSAPNLAAPWQLDIPVTNPFVPADLRAILATRPNPNATFTVSKRAAEFGFRMFTNTSQTYQALAGATGTIPGLDWSYDVYGSHGATTQVERTTAGAVSISSLRNLIAAPDGGASICAGGYNPFGITSISDACRTYLARFPVNRTTVKQDVVEGTLSGGIVDLPAGPAKFAVTGSWRRNGYTFRPDVSYASGDIASISATSFTTGDIRVAEGAIELLIPVLKDLPLVQAFNIDLGYRYSHYNTSGGVSTYKADGDWRLFPALLIRGGYQRAVRAPNTGELFLAPGQEITNFGLPPSLGDPCDVRSSYRTGANGAAVRQLCLATGLNSGIVDSFQQPTNALVTQTSGNRSLKPETADTYTIGGVFQPTFLGSLFRRFTLSVDYYNIKIKDAIAVLGASTALQNCFNGTGTNPTYDPNNYYCTLFGRDQVAGIFIRAQQPYLNLGGYKTSGIDIQADWRLPLDAVGVPGAAVTLNTIVNYLDRFEIKVLPTSPYQDFGNTLSATTSYPRWKALTSVILDLGRVEIGGRWRYINAMRDSSSVTTPASPAAGVPTYNYFDVNVRLKVTKEFELRGGVNNLGDKAPPVVAGTVASTNAGVYDVLGRTAYVGFKARF